MGFKNEEVPPVPRYVIGGVNYSNIFFPWVRRQCALDGAATGERPHPLENNGFRGLLRPAMDFAWPRSKFLSCLVTEVLELLIATSLWFSSGVPKQQQCHLGTCQKCSLGHDTVTLDQTLRKWEGPWSVPEQALREAVMQADGHDHGSDSSWLTQLSSNIYFPLSKAGIFKWVLSTRHKSFPKCLDELVFLTVMKLLYYFSHFRVSKLREDLEACQTTLCTLNTIVTWLHFMNT